MNCTVCGKSHSKEEPITIFNEYQRLCPNCFKVLRADQHLDIGNYIKRSLTCYTASIKVGDMELPVERFELQ